MHPPGKILVIRGGAIGDFILTLPVLAALREQFPACPLEVMGYAHIASLAQTAGLADHVHSIEARPLASFFAQHGSLPEDLADYFSEFALIVSYLYDPDEIFQTNIRRCSLAQFIRGPHRPDERLGQHATSCLLQPLERLAIFQPNPVPRLSLPRTRPDTHPLLALHPGSGSEQKNWPEPQWQELLLHLTRETNLQLLLVGGEAEEQRLHRLQHLVSSERLSCLHNLPLPQLAQHLAQCDGFLGHDSGISHLAAAVGLPSLILWGTTQAAVWRPLGERIHILQHPEGLPQLPVDDVLHHLGQLLPGTLNPTA